MKTPVDFMVAIKEHNENDKSILCDYLGRIFKKHDYYLEALIDGNGEAISADEILYGKWYILD